jgi:hypothetical protein
MRGLKPITFDQFSELCGKSDTGEFEVFCGIDKPDAVGWVCLCQASSCPKWRKLGRADIKVVKITARSKRPVQQLKAAIALVRETAEKHLTNGLEYSDFVGDLDTIEQRAAI